MQNTGPDYWSTLIDNNNIILASVVYNIMHLRYIISLLCDCRNHSREKVKYIFKRV